MPRKAATASVAEPRTLPRSVRSRRPGRDQPGSAASRRRAGWKQMARPRLGARQGPHPVQNLLVEAGGALVMLSEVLVPGGHFEDFVDDLHRGGSRVADGVEDQ